MILYDSFMLHTIFLDNPKRETHGSCELLSSLIFAYLRVTNIHFFLILTTKALMTKKIFTFMVSEISTINTYERQGDLFTWRCANAQDC